MFKKRFFLGFLLIILLASCTESFTPELATPSLTLLPGITLSEQPISSLTYTPPTPEARIQNGDLALFNGDFALAQTEYQTAFASTSDTSIRAAALWGLGRADMQAGNSGSALEDFNQLIVNYPDSTHRAQAHFLRGEILMGLERYVEAVEAYSTYLLLQPGVIDFYCFERRGDAYAALGDFTDAIGDYQSALNSLHNDTDPGLEIKLARAYEYAGDTVTALGMYDSIASTTSNDYIKAQMDLFAGQLHLSLGQPDQAYSRFLHSVENYPLAYDSYSALVALVEAGIPVDDLNRGLVDYYAGQYGYALDAFTRYATSFPENDGTVYYYRALALRDSGLYQEAVDSFAFFITNYPSNFYWKVACEDKADTQWFRLGQYEAAVETMMAFIHTTSDISAIPQALLDTGRIAERAGLLDQAAGLWISLADTYPESALVPQALFWAGIVQYRAGNYEQALLSFQRGSLFSLDPEDQVRAIFWTAKTKQNLGDSTASQALLQQAASMDQTDYYSLRAQDMLFNRSPFDLPRVYTFDTDLVAERLIADAWLRVTFGLPIDTDLSGLGELSLDARLLRGTELYNLDLAEEALFEFENLRNAISENAAASYRLGNYLLDLGLCTPAIFALRQVLTLAGMDQQSETLAAPRYFNLVRYGLYYQELILPLAQQTGFDPLFLFSVMRQESLYDKLAGSGQGALGLMQITPDTGQMIADNSGWPPSFETDDLYLPVVSIEMGASHLLDLRLRYNGELYTALAAYNAGPNAAPIWRDLSGPDPDLFLETIRYPETHAYIRSIYEIYSMYHYLYETVP